MRSINEKKKSKKSGSPATRPRDYVYHRQLLFLKKIVTPADTHDSATIATPNLADDSTTAITVTSDVTHDSAMAQDHYCVKKMPQIIKMLQMKVNKKLKIKM